jgi:hypothetical protein
VDGDNSIATGIESAHQLSRSKAPKATQPKIWQAWAARVATFHNAVHRSIRASTFLIMSSDHFFSFLFLQAHFFSFLG